MTFSHLRYLLPGLLLVNISLYGQKKTTTMKSWQPMKEAPALFDQYVQETLGLWKTPGISVAVVKDGRVVFKKGYGVEELGKPAPFTTGTLGVCASTTKAMTAVCMGMLVDEGKVQWSDKLQDVFPEFHLSDPALSAELTVRDLFTHDAGLGNSDLLWVLGFSREEILKKMQLLPIAYSLRSSFVYQNCMYIAAGELIRKLSGQSWEDFISSRLFAPVGMTHTYASYSRSSGEASHEHPHFMIKDSVRPIPFLEYGSVGPAGGVWSCAEDVAKWMNFLLDSARVGGRRLLKPATFRELFKPQSFVTEQEFYPTQRLTHPNWTTYGLGWFQEDYRGKMVQFHTGSLDGAVAILGMIPSEHFGIYIFGNLDHSEMRHALMYKAMDLWGFDDPNGRDWSREMYAMYKEIHEEGKKREQESEVKRAKGTKPSLAMAAYTGNYTNDIYGEAKVTLRGDSLRVEFPNQVAMNLGHWNFDTFVGTYEYFWWGKNLLQFELDAEGKVAKFDLDGMEYALKPPADSASKGTK